MKFLMVPAIALMALAGAASAEVRPLQNFHAVGAEGRFNVDVAMGEDYSVSVEGRDAAKVQSTVEDGTLRLREINRPWFGGPKHLDAVVHITMPRVTAFSAAKGATLHAAEIRAEDLAVSGAMGAEMVLSGQCHSLQVSGSMGADIDADHLDCASAAASASMGAEIRVHAREALSASASMGGDIQVSGDPKTRAAHAGMGGDVSYN